MSLMPAFEIGVSNAWVFMLALLFFVAAFMALGQLSGNLRKRLSASAVVPPRRTEKRLVPFRSILLLVTAVYSVFLPLQLGTPWFYVGLVIFLLAMIMYVITLVSWVIAPPNDISNHLKQ